MEDLGKPVPEKLEALNQLIKETMGDMGQLELDFQNTEIAFSGKSDTELQRSAWLFGLMNKYWLVGIGSKIGLAAIKMHLPFVESIVKNTIYQQFCGGTTLLDSQKTIDSLYRQNVHTVLDYGAEAKETEKDFNHTMNETIRALEYASQHQSVAVVSSKITGMARFELLEKISAQEPLDDDELQEYENVLKRLDSVCHVASQRNVQIYFDAEDYSVQQALDALVNKMMNRYNREKPIVFNTFQMYRVDRLDYLMESFDVAKKEGFYLGAKLVRGAYMEKERERAKELGYPSPIHPNKEATDHAYNQAVRFCVDHFEEMASCNATHNKESSRLQAELINERGIPRNHPNLVFCQLYGMSDNISFNLAHAGFNVAKYLPYGPVREVLPYLIRRAHENTSVSGDMSREYELVTREMKRRKLD